MRTWPRGLPCGSRRCGGGWTVELGVDVAASGCEVTHGLASRSDVGPRARRDRGTTAHRLRQARRESPGDLGVPVDYRIHDMKTFKNFIGGDWVPPLGG